MKLSAFALDYDGTIAVDGVLDADVRDAIAVARRQGIMAILVTGRRLVDLRRVAGDLTCFDVVVAENGGVLDFPVTGRHVVLGHRPYPAFVDGLRCYLSLRKDRRRGAHVTVGETVVETDATSADAALDVLRTLELPLILAFNRGRLMVLPQGVAKSTGLRQALSALRLSIHNTIGIGDAESVRLHGERAPRTARPYPQGVHGPALGISS